MSFGGTNTFQQYSTDFGLGHNGVKISFNYYDGIPEYSFINAIGSNEVSLIFKLLLKRDETTRDKALSDLLKLLDKFTEDNYLFTNEVFPLCWSQVYPKLLLSDSKNVRIQSHQVTTTLIRVLHKKVSKFLRDFIPPLLLGTCDSDNLVSKSCNVFISQCFNKEPRKIDALWTLFHEDILNLVKQIIVLENEESISDERYVDKEDSQLRYNRLLTSTVMLLKTLIEHHEGITTYKGTYKDILASESLWKLLNLKNSLFLKSYDISLQLLRLLYDTNYLATHKEILKISVKKLLKSLAQVNSKNVLKLSYVPISVLDSLTLLDRYKDGRVWSYDKSSKDKLINFLSVCSMNPQPGFFSAMLKFYEETSSHQLLCNETNWLPLWRKSIRSLNERSFLGRYGADLLAECWICYLKFVATDGNSKGKENILIDAVSTLRAGQSLDKLQSLKIVLKDVLPQDFITNEIAKELKDENVVAPLEIYLENLMTLLITSTEADESAKMVIQSLLSIVNQGNISVSTIKLVAKLFRIVIRSNLQSVSSEMLEFIGYFPKLLYPETYSDLVIVAIEYSKNKAFDINEKYIAALEDFIKTSLSQGISNEGIINLLCSLERGVLESLLKTETIDNFVNEHIDSYRYEDDGKLFGSPLINQEITYRLFESAKVHNFLEYYCEAAQNLNSIQKEYLLKNTDFINAIMFRISSIFTQKAFEIVEPYLKSDKEIIKKLCGAIIDHTKVKSIDDEDNLYIEYACYIIEVSSDNIQYFFPPNFTDLFVETIPFIDYRLSLITCLGLNVHLLPTSQNTLDINTIESLLKYGHFVDELCSKISWILSERILVFLTMLAELADDFNCLSTSPQEQLSEFKHTLFKSKSNEVSASSIIKILIGIEEGNQTTEAIFSVLRNASSDPSVECYHFRLVYKILLNEVDCLTTSSLNSLLPSIEKYITDIIRSKSSGNHDYMTASIILSALSNFSGQSSFMKIRNILAAECIGARENEIYKKTYKIIILLNNMMSNEKEAPPISPQRLGMMLKTIEQWLDSDIVYEPQFAVMRMSLLKFFVALVSNPYVTNSNPSTIELAVKLLIDSLSMCQVEDNEYTLELRSYSLELYHAISSMDQERLPAEYASDILPCIAELCLIAFQNDKNNQLSVNFYRSLSKAINSFEMRYLLDYYDSFLEQFLTVSEIKDFNRTRLLTGVLQNLIKEKQQEAVVEYELRNHEKQKHENDSRPEGLDDFEEEMINEERFELPQELIKKLVDESPQDYLEYENEFVFLKYLWYWNIVLQYFDSSSYNLRQLFIDQLKSEDLIYKFFYFVSDQIDLQETEFWSNIEEIAIVDYNATNDDFSPYKEDILIECKKLLAHLLYKMFDDVGSLTASWWLNIKDRSFQSKIEKFVSRFISPILISHELDIVSTKMENLTSKDSALNIKINKVTDEVKAIYLIDEQKLEISFKLPKNYPLTNIEVVGISRVGISEQKWKQWILSTQRVITGMNGSVMDSLELFTKNVNLQFSGFEECAICYSILHAVDRKLPTKTCPTCNNKFHGACLYKWFRSSGNNTCPLCRSEIPFRR